MCQEKRGMERKEMESVFPACIKSIAGLFSRHSRCFRLHLGLSVSLWTCTVSFFSNASRMSEFYHRDMGSTDVQKQGMELGILSIKYRSKCSFSPLQKEQIYFSIVKHTSRLKPLKSLSPLQLIRELLMSFSAYQCKSWVKFSSCCTGWKLTQDL